MFAWSSWGNYEGTAYCRIAASATTAEVAPEIAAGNILPMFSRKTCARAECMYDYPVNTGYAMRLKYHIVQVICQYLYEL